ncbi:hypothetical protein NVIRPANT_01020 [Pantoea sp. Nvir]|nr:hypothetical protein NVIRPANT_01020 [Pantoea sp. Nvir]
MYDTTFMLTVASKIQMAYSRNVPILTTNDGQLLTKQ